MAELKIEYGVSTTKTRIHKGKLPPVGCYWLEIRLERNGKTIAVPEALPIPLGTPQQEVNELVQVIIDKVNNANSKTDTVEG